MALKLGKCRLCLKLGDFYSIFTVDNSLQLAEMVMECAKVKVYEGDGLPDKICTECVQKLSSAFIFKQQCERSDQELRRNYVPPPGEAPQALNTNLSDQSSAQAKQGRVSLRDMLGFSVAPSPNRQSSDSAFSSQTESSNQKQAETKTPAPRRKRSRDSTNSSVTEYRPSPKNQRVEQIKTSNQRKRYESDSEYEDASVSQLSIETDSDEPLVTDHACDVCPKAFKSKKSLAQHKRIHSDKRLGSNAVVDIPKPVEDAMDDDQKLACERCGKTFKLKIMLKRHYDSCIKTPQKELQIALEPVNPHKKYSCEMCPTTFKTVDNLEKHMRVCHAAILKNKDLEKTEKVKKAPPTPTKVSVPCIYCRSEFDDYYVHSAHFLECPKKTKAMSFECPLCQKVTYKQSSYFVHIKNVHFEPRCGTSVESSKTDSFQCRMCSKKLPNQEQLIQHLAAHVSNIDDTTHADDDDPHLEAASSASQASQDDKVETGFSATPMKCRHCDKTFHYKKSLITHELRHTEDEMKEEPPEPPDVSSTFNEDEEDSDDSQDDGDNTCDICEKMFSYKRLLINHKKTKHNMSSGTKRASIVVKNCMVKCQICEAEMKVGDSVEHNRYHISRNEKPKNVYTCAAEGCGDTFKSCTTLATHIKMVHRLKRQVSKKMAVPDLADFCEVVVTKSEPLDAVQSHSDPEAVPASTKKLQGDLTGFTCPICAKKMPTLISLKRHVNWHSNVGNHLEKSLECAVCKETFRFRVHYKLHMRQHYNDTNLDPKFLTCAICGRRSKHLRAAQAHMNYHKQTRFQGKDYKCAICAKVFQVRKVYLSHMAVHFKRGESGQNTIVGNPSVSFTGENTCHLCGKVCDSENSLKHHLIWHKSKTLLYGSLHQCTMCDLKFTNKQSLKVHIRTHYEDEAGPFKCPTCGKGYTDEDYFRRHVKGHNFDHQSHAKRIAKLRENKVKCPICERYYADLPKLIRHLRRTHPQSKMIKEDPDAPPLKVYSCKLCAKVFHDERRYKFHQERHLRKPTHITCKFCFKTCLSQKLFSLHVRAHLYRKLDTPMPCPHCDMTFKRALDFQRHLKCTHNIIATWEATKDTVKPDKLKEFQCSLCYKILKSKGNYERHLDFHNTLRCNYCFEYFSALRFLEGHLAFSCEKRKLLGDTETVPRRIKCDICYKAFHVQVKLDCHMRAAHGVLVAKTRQEASVNITCDYCFKVFENEDALSSHKVYHRTVGFYGCLYCERKFNTVTLYNKHKNHHFAQINVDNPFKCEHCDETFVPFRDMIYHMRDVHDDDKDWLVMPKEVTEEMCSLCNKVFHNLPRHLAYHEENRCKKCSEYFYSRVDYDEHLCAVDSDAEEGAAPGQPPPNYEECGFCFKQYTRSGSKLMHKNLHHTSGAISCRFCSLKFKTMDAFNIHAFSHRSRKYRKKPLKCRYCGEKFIQYGPFMKHLKGVHGRKEKMHYRTKVKAEVCVICNEMFPNLHNHYRAHLQNRCAKCGKYFTSSRVFSYHECDKEDIDPTKVFTSDANLLSLIKNYQPKDERDDEKLYDITDDEEEEAEPQEPVTRENNPKKYCPKKRPQKQSNGNQEYITSEFDAPPEVTIDDEDSQNSELSHLMPISIQSPIISDVLSLYQEKKDSNVIDLVDDDSIGFEPVTLTTVEIDDDD